MSSEPETSAETARARMTAEADAEAAKLCEKFLGCWGLLGTDGKCHNEKCFQFGKRRRLNHLHSLIRDTYGN